MNSFDEYQNRCSLTAIYSEDHAIIYPALGLASEAGEVAGKVKKYLRDGTSFFQLRDDVTAELGDVLWYVSALAYDLDIDLSEIANQNLIKLEDRMMRNKLSGSGDER